ncbi:unnamed protein product [Citrullus colocynthis]|uniref:Uncharacterized protein n=1 Tax=Citrullus colocynthis TaxID=252529 RepID=A0ABP0Y4Z4_9ROSI
MTNFKIVVQDCFLGQATNLSSHTEIANRILKEKLMERQLDMFSQRTCVYVAREIEEDENEGHSEPSVSDEDGDDNLHNDDDNHFGGDQVLLQSLDIAHTFETHQTTLEFEMRPPHEHTTIRPPP